MDKDNVEEFLGNIEDNWADKQLSQTMGAELAKKLSDPYMNRLEAFWDQLANDSYFSKNLNKELRGLDVYGQLFTAFVNWLGDSGIFLTAGEDLALISRMDEIEKFFSDKLAAWDLEHTKKPDIL